MSPIPFIYTVRAFMDCHASSETQIHARPIRWGFPCQRY